ncbi:MAG: acyltransferase family protein, partial [Candidatus Binatia bacterium]
MNEPVPQNRLLSLDVFRGITIAGMVLVNNPGTSPVYWPLDHAEWNGLTPTDYIFPFFLFIVGVAISISLGKRVAVGVTTSVYTKIFSRAATIYLLGQAVSVVPFFSFASTDAPDWLKMAVWLLFTFAILFLLLRNYRVAMILAGVAVLGIAAMRIAGYSMAGYDLSTIRIMGVLPRIAVCYLVTSLIFLHTNWKQQLGISIVLLLGYWLIMTVIAVPGCDATTMNDKACNLAAYLDRLIIGENHIWRFGKVYDPEGLLSTIPAIVTTISGVLTGTWLVRKNKIETNRGDNEATDLNSSLNKVSGLFFFGVILFALGWVWNSFFPFNKSLWTSSYVLVTSGLALFTLGCCYWLVDIKGYKAWAKPFMIFGANAHALFVFTGFFARMMSSYKVVAADGTRISIQGWIIHNVFLPIL